jgi:hypothetical protein
MGDGTAEVSSLSYGDGFHFAKIAFAQAAVVRSQLFRLRQKIFKDMAPFTQAHMLKILPDRSGHCLRACRRQF